MRGTEIYMDRSFVKKDFDELKKLKLYGRLCESVDAELYWFNCIDREDAAFSQTLKKHHHDFFEIHFVLNGRMVYNFDSGTAVAEAPSVLIIPAGEGHTIESYSSDMLKVSVAVKIGENEPLYAGLFENGRRAMSVEGRTVDDIAFCAEMSGKSIPYRERLVKERIFAILCNIAGELSVPSQRQTPFSIWDEPDMRLFKAKQFIKDNESIFPSCEELARYCNISVKQLNRIFLKYEEITLLKYIHSEKISQAKTMLSGEKLSLNEVSESLGFSSVYYFCKFFTSHTGISPGAFKKEKCKKTSAK